MTDDDSGGAGGAGEGAAVTELRLTIGHDGSFGHCVNRENIADSERGY